MSELFLRRLALPVLVELPDLLAAQPSIAGEGLTPSTQERDNDAA